MNTVTISLERYKDLEAKEYAFNNRDIVFLSNNSGILSIPHGIKPVDTTEMLMAEVKELQKELSSVQSELWKLHWENNRK